MSTQPTDAEILELASQYWYSLDETESETEIQLVRAALAKWGTPARSAGAVERSTKAAYPQRDWSRPRADLPRGKLLA